MICRTRFFFFFFQISFMNLPFFSDLLIFFPLIFPMHSSKNEEDAASSSGSSSEFWQRTQKPLPLQRILLESSGNSRPADGGSGHIKISPPSPSKRSLADKENEGWTRVRDKERTRCGYV
jgi:hypothetical protein